VGRLWLACLLGFLGAGWAPTPAPAKTTERSQTNPASSPVLTGTDGWLFLSAEFRFLQTPVFWGGSGGGASKGVSRSGTGETTDPLEAIAHYRDQLAAEGIRLLLVPVPPKALALRAKLPAEAAARVQADTLPRFFEQLRARKVEVLDLLPVFAKGGSATGDALYCKTDSHWSGTGCQAAARAIADALRPTLEAVPKRAFSSRTVSAEFVGDLSELQSPPSGAKETLPVRQVSLETGEPLQPDASSPLLLLGDSHTLVFHDFLAERAGLLDQLALETGVVPDLIGTRGSGANAVRVSLLRRTIKDPAYLRSKRVVVWCFAAREFTEADPGWQKIPAKK
jgi:alginate O-acetyltransferase complex protein AlgJ